MELVKVCSKMLIFITFHKLCQTVTFWGRYLASENVTNMKNKNMVKTHFFSFSQAQYGHLAVYKQKE